MSTIQEQLVAYLAPIAELHPRKAPQGTVPPYVTYQRVASPTNNVLSGPPSIGNVRMQVDVWAATYAEAQSLSESIVQMMQAWSVQNILLNNYDLGDDVVNLERVLLEFSIWQ